MNKVTMSNEAYTEFKNFLEENNVADASIRIQLGGMSCHGPVFNISVDEAKEEDVTEKINDLTFVVETSLIDEFGGFTILSTEENGGRGLSLKPLIEPEESGCGSCGGGCGH